MFFCCYQHERWGGATSQAPFPDDIAVLKLASKITLGDTVNTIPLATDANIDNWAECYIKGWGVFGKTIKKVLSLAKPDPHPI